MKESYRIESYTREYRGVLVSCQSAEATGVNGTYVIYHSIYSIKGKREGIWWGIKNTSIIGKRYMEDSHPLNA